MNPSKIIFYEPKSLSASIIGVVANMILTVLPIALLAYWQSSLENPSWIWVLLGLPIGLLLMQQSEFLIFPLVGTKHEFLFDKEFVEIITPKGKEKIAIKDLKITAFEVDMDSGSVKHVVLEWADGRKIDIFDTWVTGETAAGFDAIFKKYFVN